MSKKPAKKLSLKKETAKRLTVDSSEIESVKAGLKHETGGLSTFIETNCAGTPTGKASLCAGWC